MIAIEYWIESVFYLKVEWLNCFYYVHCVGVNQNEFEIGELSYECLRSWYNYACGNFLYVVNVIAFYHLILYIIFIYVWIKGKAMNDSFFFGLPEPHPTHTEVPRTKNRYRNINKKESGNYKAFSEF